MPRHEQEYFVKFKQLKRPDNFFREPPGVFAGAWGSRARRGRVLGGMGGEKIP
jgi:hypothetical protein